MKLYFNKVVAHHFFSLDHVELDLRDRGYVAVEGVNHREEDAATSNGCGKSSIFNSIVFALTGETINGVSKNISNIYFNDGCYVSLDFDINNTNYLITR